VRVDEFGELGEDLYHFVGTFAAGGHDDDVGFGLLGDGVLEDGLTRAERAGDEACAAFDDGVDRVDGADAGLEEFEGAGLFGVERDGHLNGPLEGHVDGGLAAFVVGEDGDGVEDRVAPFGDDATDGVRALHHEGDHDLQGLVVLFDLAEEVGGLDAVACVGDGGEVPEAFGVEREVGFAALEEDAVELVEVVLQTVVVVGEHTGAEGDFEHVAGELYGVINLESAGALKDLDVGVAAGDFDDFGHEAYAGGRDIADFALEDRAVNLDGDEVADDAFY
jgi:hypothetical protein